MRHYLYLLSTLYCLLYFNTVLAQTTVSDQAEARDLYSNAKNYILKNDLANAIMVLNQAVQIDPNSLTLRKELANTYYINNDFLLAEKMIAPLLKRSDADESTFLIAANTYTAMNRTDDTKEALNKGLSKFPNSGILYASKGDYYNKLKKYKTAAQTWEKGIEMDPGYHLNYYNLSKVYYFTKNYLWAIWYGETFVNLESFSSKTEEVKKIVFESYKFLMGELNNQALDGKVNRYENPKNFKESCLKIFDQLRPVVTGGINPENITMLRVRFLLEWNKKYAAKYPYELIDHQHRLLTRGYYDSYNMWLFGKLDNDKAYRNWTQKNADLMNRFDKYLRSYKLKPKQNQYYQN